MTTYFLPHEKIRPIAEGYGACIASDEILVLGKPVGYCYREVPDQSFDSGWRFFSGDETQEYADDPNNFAYYDINTIANYDPRIIAIIKFPIGAMFERDEEGNLTLVEDDS